MKTLYLLRHAKSSWSDSRLEDFERPLNGRGIKTAPRMATFMRDKDLRPDLALCSSATRAQQTWDLVSAVLGPDIPTKHLRSLYLAAPGRLLSIVQRQPDKAESLLLVGHNPGLEQLAARLAGAGSSKAALAALHQKFPTAALAVLRFDVEHWADVAESAGKLHRLVSPKDLD